MCLIVVKIMSSFFCWDSECQQFYILLKYDIFIKIMLFLQMNDYTEAPVDSI